MYEKEPNSKYLFSAYQKEKDKSKIKILRFVISINSNLDGFVHADMTRKTDFICQQKKGIPIPDFKSIGQIFHFLLLGYQTSLV